MNNDWINNHEWRENIPSPLSREDIARFQEKLNKIVGVEPDGTPHLKLVWGQDQREDGMWDREGYWVPRHHWSTVYDNVANEKTGLIELVPKYIGVPRYFVLAYVPPVHLPESERVASFDGKTFFTPEMNETQWVDFLEGGVCVHTPKREDGWRDCCEKAATNGVNCFGLYRPPDEKDLDYIHRCYQQWQRMEQRIDPNLPFKKNDHSARWRAMTAKQQAQKEKEKAERKKEIADFFTVLDTKVAVPDVPFLRGQ